jgi:CDP-glucose 4,6-dehydratase
MTARGHAFAEGEPLGGKDPYSASKACTELVCESYAHSFLGERGVVLATARAGNVIGGGDWAEDRLVPDFIRALECGAPVRLRYPQAVRPWQHVLEPLGGYLAYAQALTESGGAVSLPTALNFGPRSHDFMTVAEMAEALGRCFGLERAWEQAPGNWESEAPVLMLESAPRRRYPRLARAARPAADGRLDGGLVSRAPRRRGHARLHPAADRRL